MEVVNLLTLKLGEQKLLKSVSQPASHFIVTFHLTGPSSLVSCPIFLILVLYLLQASLLKAISPKTSPSPLQPPMEISVYIYDEVFLGRAYVLMSGRPMYRRNWVLGC